MVLSQIKLVQSLDAPELALSLIRLLTPALSSSDEEREN
jgi:hypothetical protein